MVFIKYVDSTREKLKKNDEAQFLFWSYTPVTNTRNRYRNQLSKFLPE